MKLRLAMLMGFVLLSLAGPSWAAGESFSGTYRLDEGASDNIQEAFEPALSEMGRVRRTFARQALRRASHEETLQIRIEGTEISMQAGQRPRLELPIDGTEREVVGENGGRARGSARLVNDRLEVRVKGERGTSTTIYRLEGNRLIGTITFENEELSKPVTFRVVYRRE